MAYTRFSETSDWYIYWAETDAVSPEHEQLELLRADGSQKPVRLSFAEAARAASSGVLPDKLTGVRRSETSVILAALREFVSDVRGHYAGAAEARTTADAMLAAEAQRASEMLGGKTVGIVRRRRRSEVVIEFTDGTRLLVHIAGDDLDLSIE